MKVAESVALVTGANRGIGKAFVEQLLALGVRKVYAAGRKLKDLESVVALDPKRVIPVQLDITNPESVAQAATQVTDLTLLVNNAGTATAGSVLTTPVQTLRNDMEVNYFGTISATQAFAPIIEKNGGGVVVNLLSVVSFVTFPMFGGYNASKAAEWSFTQALRADLAPKKIKVVGVFPGPIDTDMAKDIPFDKTPPIHVAQEVFAGIDAGHEDIFPDPMSKQLYQGWKADHKAIEKQFAS